MAARRIALATARPEQLAAEVAAALQRGELCALPTETVYGLALLPSAARAVERVRALKGRRAEHEFTFHLAAAAEAAGLVRTDDVRVRRLIARYWPGPLTLVLPGHDGRAVGVRVPAHEFARRTITAAGAPLWLTSVNRSGDPPLCEAGAITAAFGDELAIVVDDGPSPLGTASTVVRCTGPELEVLREGILARDEVLHTAAAHVLFVCTGNTCRSPMAEVLARDAVARALDVAPGRVLARGLLFLSAGTGTLDGMAASEGSVQALQQRGLDLGAHRSRSLTQQLCVRAARIFCMSASHRDAVLDLVPDAAPKTVLLRADGRNIADPYGGELADYCRARDEITAAIGERLRELLGLLPAD